MSSDETVPKRGPLKGGLCADCAAISSCSDGFQHAALPGDIAPAGTSGSPVRSHSAACVVPGREVPRGASLHLLPRGPLSAGSQHRGVHSVPAGQAHRGPLQRRRRPPLQVSFGPHQMPGLPGGHGERPGRHQVRVLSRGAFPASARRHRCDVHSVPAGQAHPETFRIRRRLRWNR